MTTIIPADNLERNLAVADSNSSQVPHIGLVGDTYTILLTAKDTAGQYCLIDMHLPPGGGPPPHRHDFEESFTVLGGETEATFRGVSSVVRVPVAGRTTPPPAPDPATQAAMGAKVEALAPKSRTELLKQA